MTPDSSRQVVIDRDRNISATVRVSPLGDDLADDLGDQSFVYDQYGTLGPPDLWMGNFDSDVDGDTCTDRPPEGRVFQISTCQSLFQSGLLPSYFQGVWESDNESPLSIRFDVGSTAGVIHNTKDCDLHRYDKLYTHYCTWWGMDSYNTNTGWPYKSYTVGANISTRSTGAPWFSMWAATRGDHHATITRPRSSSNGGVWDGYNGFHKFGDIYDIQSVCENSVSRLSAPESFRQCMWELSLVYVCKDLAMPGCGGGPPVIYDRLAICAYALHGMFENNWFGAYSDLVASGGRIVDGFSMPFHVGFNRFGFFALDADPPAGCVTRSGYPCTTVGGKKVESYRVHYQANTTWTFANMPYTKAGHDEEHSPYQLVFTALPYLRKSLTLVKGYMNAVCLPDNVSLPCSVRHTVELMSQCSRGCYSTFNTYPVSATCYPDSDAAEKYLYTDQMRAMIPKNKFVVKSVDGDQPSAIYQGADGCAGLAPKSVFLPVQLPCSSFPYYKWPYNGGPMPTDATFITYPDPDNEGTCSAPYQNGCLAWLGFGGERDGYMSVRNFPDPVFYDDSLKSKYPGLTIVDSGSYITVSFSASAAIEPPLFAYFNSSSPSTQYQYLQIGSITSLNATYMGGFLGEEITVRLTAVMVPNQGTSATFFDKTSSDDGNSNYEGGGVNLATPANILMTCLQSPCALTLTAQARGNASFFSQTFLLVVPEQCFTCGEGSETDVTEDAPVGKPCFIVCNLWPDWSGASEDALIAGAAIAMCILVTSIILCATMIRCPAPRDKSE